LAAQAQAERDVLEHVQVRKQCIVLEDHAQSALFRRQPGHVAAVDENVAARGLLEARHHAQGGGLAAARRSQQRDQFAAGNVQ